MRRSGVYTVLDDMGMKIAKIKLGSPLVKDDQEQGILPHSRTRSMFLTISGVKHKLLDAFISACMSCGDEHDAPKLFLMGWRLSGWLMIDGWRYGGTQASWGVLSSLTEILLLKFVIPRHPSYKNQQTTSNISRKLWGKGKPKKKARRGGRTHNLEINFGFAKSLEVISVDQVMILEFIYLTLCLIELAGRIWPNLCYQKI